MKIIRENTSQLKCAALASLATFVLMLLLLVLIDWALYG